MFRFANYSVEAKSCDNSSAKTLLNGCPNRKLRQILILAAVAVRESKKRNEIRLQNVDGADQLADGMIKALVGRESSSQIFDENFHS